MKAHTLSLAKGLALAVIVGVVFIGTINISPGAGSGSGNGGGQGSGESGAETPDLGDLIILYRDEDGVPIPTASEQVTDPETGLNTEGGLCQQPLAFNVSDAEDALCPKSCLREDITGIDVVKVDSYYCSVDAGCAACTQEVDFERTNVVRSPAAVFESQLDDVIVNLSTADCVTLDPAGRLVASSVDPITGAVLSSTIDSPLQNLAIYRQLMLTGGIGATLPNGADRLDTAARGIGVGSGKSGKVNVDMVAYINEILGLTAAESEGMLIGKIEEDYREEVQGQMQRVTKTFLNYRSYGYERLENFATEEQSLPRPAYIPDDTSYGFFEYLSLVPNSLATFEIKQGSILNAVFCDGINCDTNPAEINTGFTGGNAGGFAQAADDTRAVINFMHNWPMPLGYTTPIPCEPRPAGDLSYDLSISDDSGLQVPVRMIDGMEEGREFIVTVANGGPDIASGTVTVSAIETNGISLEGFPRSFYFNGLDAASSTVFTENFAVALGHASTIEWTATVTGDNSNQYEVNTSNNSVTATTVIKVTGGKQ